MIEKSIDRKVYVYENLEITSKMYQIYQTKLSRNKVFYSDKKTIDNKYLRLCKIVRIAQECP